MTGNEYNNKLMWRKCDISYSQLRVYLLRQEGLTFEEIAQKLGTCRQAVNQSYHAVCEQIEWCKNPDWLFPLDLKTRNAIKKLGYKNKEEVKNALLSNRTCKDMQFIGEVRFNDLIDWCGLELVPIEKTEE